MSISSIVVDSATGWMSYGISALTSMFYHHSDNLTKERTNFYKHALAVKTQQISDVQSARSYDTDGSRWTRRLIAMIIPLFFITMSILGLLAAYGHNVMVSVLVKDTHHFLTYSWTTTKILVMKGLPYFSWIPQLFFMIAGFYYGTKRGH